MPSKRKSSAKTSNSVNKTESISSTTLVEPIILTETVNIINSDNHLTTEAKTETVIISSNDNDSFEDEFEDQWAEYDQDQEQEQEQEQEQVQAQVQVQLELQVDSNNLKDAVMPDISDILTTASVISTISLDSDSVSLPEEVKSPEIVDIITQKRIHEGNIILEKLKKDGYKVCGIDGDMIISDWSDTENIHSLDKFHTKTIISSVINYGFRDPRDIQMLTTVRVVCGGDIMVQASAGTGKTGAYGIGILLTTNPSLCNIQKMIIVPTGHLVDAVYDDLINWSKGSGIIIKRWRGGLEYPKGKDKRPHIVVGTPGRIVDMLQPYCGKDGIQRQNINLKYLTSLVLDEGDELLSQNFIQKTKQIVTSCPSTIQVCLFSATLPSCILNIANSFMNDPSLLILPDKKVITTRVEQYYINCNNEDDKVSNLLDCIKKNSSSKIIIFCNTCNGVKKLMEDLTKNSIFPISVTGKMIAADREKAIRDYKNGDNNILVASDLIARGFDDTDVNLVINYDMPNNVEIYVHRIGRAGRGGDTGNAVTFVLSEEDMLKIKYIVRFHGMPIKETADKKMKDGNNRIKFRFN